MEAIYTAILLLLAVINFSSGAYLLECNSADKKTKITCDDKIGDRLGCCIEDSKWKDLDCSKDDDCKKNPPTTPDIGDFCMKQKDDTGKEDKKGKCIFRNGVENKYMGSKVNDTNSRADFRSKINNVEKNTCNKKLYDLRIKSMWERYLLCPFDYEYYDSMLENLINDWYFNNEILDAVCFSKNIETCFANNTCGCLSKVFLDSGGRKILDFTQIKENHHCGLLAGKPCIHNVKALRQNEVDRPFTCRHTKSLGLPILPPFECEVDAGCSTLLYRGKGCPNNEICKCTCSEGQSCTGHADRQVNASLKFVSMMLIGFIPIQNIIVIQIPK